MAVSAAGEEEPKPESIRESPEIEMEAQTDAQVGTAPRTAADSLGGDRKRTGLSPADEVSPILLAYLESQEHQGEF